MSQLGTNRERQVKADLEGKGWFVIRAAASLGFADLVALKAGMLPLMCEVKATSRGPFHGFGPDDRAALIEAAEKAGATPVLAWWPKRGHLKWIYVEDWPRDRR